MTKDEMRREVRALARMFRGSARDSLLEFEIFVRTQRPDIDEHVRRHYADSPHQVYGRCL